MNYHKSKQSHALKGQISKPAFVLSVLTLASDRTVLNEDVAFSILALSTKKRSSSFLRKVLFFLEICFKFRVLKIFGISSDFHKNKLISQTEGYFENH